MVRADWAWTKKAIASNWSNEWFLRLPIPSGPEPHVCMSGRQVEQRGARATAGGGHTARKREKSTCFLILSGIIVKSISSRGPNRPTKTNF